MYCHYDEAYSQEEAKEIGFCSRCEIPDCSRNKKKIDYRVIKEIKEIISFCEDIQNSNDSVYTKNCAKQTAYDHIKNIIEEGEK